MRTINTDEIIQTVKKMCIEANLKLSEDMEKAVRNAATEEDSVLGRQILTQLCENLDIAATNLSGYRNGNILCKCWSGCSYRRHESDRCDQ